MLEFKLESWSVFKNIFTNINEIIDEVVVECTFDGLKFKGIDRGHICFFEGSISKELFDEYNISDVLLLYLDLNELVKIFKRGNNKNNLVFIADNEVIKIIYENKNNRTFSITQLDTMNDEVRELPTLDFPVTINCDFDTIKNSLKDANIYSERLSFICEDNYLILSCNGTNGNYKNEIILDETVNNSVSSTFSLDWLSKIFNNKLNPNFEINMGNDYPMLIKTELEHITMKYLIAPRLEND